MKSPKPGLIFLVEQQQQRWWLFGHWELSGQLIRLTIAVSNSFDSHFFCNFVSLILLLKVDAATIKNMLSQQGADLSSGSSTQMTVYVSHVQYL